MSTHRSHFAYRLAWENTSTERIAFLPLHRRDLVSAEEGNRTFIGGDTERINWRKFEIMGEVIVSIRESQGTPYPHINRNIDAQRLILEGRFSHDEDVSGVYIKHSSLASSLYHLTAMVHADLDLRNFMREV